MSDRLNQIRNTLEKWHVDAVLITSPANRRWLSGFTGSAGMLLVSREVAILSTDSRYWEQAERQAPDFVVYRNKTKPDDLRNFIATANANRIGFEAKHVTVAEHRTLRKEKTVRWRALGTTVEPFRAIKSAEELALIRKAAQITDRTIAQFHGLARPGKSERMLAWELEKVMRDFGADRPGFDIIVASGPNSALPHHRPGERTLQPGDIIVVDLGAEVDGYRSDLTRTFYLGTSPDDTFNEIYRIVADAQAAAINGIHDGINGKVADALARDVITAAGHGDHFGHGTGHSLGLEIHEFPRFSVNSARDKIQAGMIMTVEPGIYLPGYGGVRIEDLIVITPDGAEYLSHAPQNSLIPLS